jgi:hypothetical protein
MNTEQQLQRPNSHLFAIRLWEEAVGEGEAEWRGRVQEIVTGEIAFFRDWPGLVTTLQRLTGKPAGTPEGGATGPLAAGVEDS